MRPTIWFDLDGVLADFDKAANRVLGGDHYRYTFVYGDDLLWQRLHSSGSFFANMEMMPGAQMMLDHVDIDRVKVLTALPKTETDRVRQQKEEWVWSWLPGDVPVVTCFTKDKPNFCQPGDILIDDRAVNMKAWEEKGGRFILHTDAMSTLAQLERMGEIR